MPTRWNIEMIQKFYRDRGCVLLESDYRGVKHKYKFICKCGNEHSKRFNEFRTRPLCSRCGNMPYIEEYREYLRGLNKGNRGTFIIRPRDTLGDKDILVDEDDFESLISEGLWHVTAQGYVERSAASSNVKEKMHRVVMGALKGVSVDHINHNKLDNRKSNLRIVSYSQNGANIKKSENTKTRYKGVTISDSGKYKVRVGYENKRVYVGTFTTIEEAANAYNDAAYILHGEYAYLNKLKEVE